MFVPSSQPISSAPGSLSHHVAAEVGLSAADYSTNLKVRDNFGSLFTDVLARMAYAPPQTSGDVTFGRSQGAPLDSDYKDVEAGSDGQKKIETREQVDLASASSPRIASGLDFLPVPEHESAATAYYSDQGAKPSRPVDSELPVDLRVCRASPNELENAPIHETVTAVSVPGIQAYSFSQARPIPGPSVSQFPDISAFDSTVIPALVCQGQVGRVELQLELHSVELGRLQLRVSLDYGRVCVHLVVWDEKVKRRLKEQMCQLRSRFANMGLELIEFDLDGGNSGAAPNPQPEYSTDRAQTEDNGLPNLRKTLAFLTDPQTLVDMMT